MSSNPSSSPGEQTSSDSASIHSLSPRLIAALIRSLDSQLADIAYERSADEAILIYTFEVAGMRRSFRVGVQTECLESIVDLYPEAAAHEHALSATTGLCFESQGDP